MSDRPAQLVPWLIASILVLIFAAGYILYRTRVHAGYTTRSLTAAPSTPAADLNTRTLHVDGCDKDFIVQKGELVEPRAIPGASIATLRNLYGAESKPTTPGQQTFIKDAFTLTTATSPADQIHLSIPTGHVVETLDGVELGIDSFAAILRKLRDRKIDSHQRIDHTDGKWTIILTFYSSCSHRYRSEYSRSLPDDPETDRAIAPLTPTKPGQPTPLRSNTFMNKVVTEYTLIQSNRTDETTQGQPADRD